MKRSWWVVTLAAGLLTACSDGSTMQVSYSAVEAYADPALLSADLLWPGGGRHLDGGTFTTEFGVSRSPVFDVPTGGQLRFRAYLVTPANDTLAQVEGTLALEQNYLYGAGVTVGPTWSQSFCTSLADRDPVLPPGATVTGDTLFLELNGLQEDAVC